MRTNNAPTRGRRSGVSLLGAVVLVVALFGTVALRNPAQRVASAPHAAANVFVEPYASQSLWVNTMDPAQITSLTDADILQKIYTGLVKQSYDDKTGKFVIVPDLAAGMPTVSNGGLVYTFKIRTNTGFSDGTPVTAQDFVWSFERVLDPKAASPANYYLFAIKGASDYANGKTKSFSSVGAKALDAHTLQITLAKPVVWFLYALSYDTGFVVKKGLSSTAKLTTDPSLVVGAGPFMLKGGTWRYRSQITLVPNPHYWEASRIKLKELDLIFTGSVDTAFAGYRSGQFPITPLPVVEVANNRSAPEFHNTPVLGDVYYTMNTHVKPFSDIHFRRAIAYGINRDAVTKGVLHGTEQSLYGWYPKGILGYDSNILRNSNVPYFNLTRAKAELALAKKDLGSIPAIQFEVGTEHRDRVQGAQEVAQEMKAVGINMSLHLVPGTTWIKDGNTGKTPFIFGDWYNDYPDPQDFSFYLIETGAAENWGRYSNPTVDALFAKGDVERDTQKREAIYKQAQLIILRDAPIAMLYQSATQDLISGKYHGVEMNPSSGNFVEPLKNDWANATVSS